jgi:hypothetical protein
MRRSSNSNATAKDEHFRWVMGSVCNKPLPSNLLLLQGMLYVDYFQRIKQSSAFCLRFGLCELLL